MMTTKSRLLTKVSCGFSIAFLAFAFTSGVSAVRAQTDVPSWMMVDPISTAVKALEERLTSLEAKVASIGSPASGQSTELCVADDAGARTCISKAQLDRLLKITQAATAQVTNPVAALAEPAEAVPAASAPETPAAEEPAKIETTTATAVEASRQAEQAAAATLEQDSMPTGSISAPESQGRALVTHPEVEITIP